MNGFVNRLLRKKNIIRTFQMALIDPKEAKIEITDEGTTLNSIEKTLENAIVYPVNVVIYLVL